jgi:hypothetical protein
VSVHKLAMLLWARLRSKTTMPSPCGHAVRHLVLSTLGAILLAFGCAGAGSDTQRRLDDLEHQVLSAQNRNDRLEERVAALEAALDADRPRTPQEASEQQPAAAEEHGPQLPVVKLGPNTDEAVDADPPPDALESESANQSPADPRADDTHGPAKPGQRGPNTAVKKSVAPASNKPREVIKVHGDGPQSRLSAPEPDTPSEVQNTCPV